MTSKRNSAKKCDANKITAVGKPKKSKAADNARTVLRPSVQAAFTLQEYNKSYENFDLASLVDSLEEQVKASEDGDSQRAEAMLITQAHTLEAIFNCLARRAINAEYMEYLDTYLKLALRAQSQCRATWEVLSTINNPPVMGYVRQANIAHGPQQVNNSTPNNTPRARDNQNPKNELMEKKDGERLDTGATSTTSQADPAMATVGEIDRTKNQGR